LSLRVGHLSTFYHTAIILMARGDLQNVLDDSVQWRLFGTGPAIVNAFEKGEIDLAYIGLPPAVIGMSRGVNIVCVAGGHEEGTVLAGGKECSGFPEERNLRSILGQFEGKKIGVPGSGSIHDVIIREYIARFGLGDAVEVINFAWADQVLEAVAKGVLSAAVGTPALAVAVKTYTGGKILCPASMLWPHNPSYGILVDRNFMNERRELVKRFLVLHEEATALMRNRPAEAARTISDYVGFIGPEFVMETLKVSPKYCAQLTAEYISATMEFVKTLKELGYISREVASGEIFDTSLIAKIHPEKDHYEGGIAEAEVPG
jgi:NitT/TauT family transport system substrate-binding protein